MNSKIPPLRSQFRRWYVVAFIFFPTAWLIQSCSTSCHICEKDNTKIYQVELNEKGADQYGSNEIITYFQPDSLQRGRNNNSFYIIDCGEEEPYKLPKEELQQFTDSRRKEINASYVKRTTRTSDADLPPLLVKPNSDAVCNRYRPIVKIEARVMGGVRLDVPEYYSKPGAGQIGREWFALYEQGGFGIFGIEAAALPRIFTVAKKHSFNIGPMIGAWPVDGGLFVPLSVHPRFTFHDITNPFKGDWLSCNAIYLFGDYGLSFRTFNIGENSNNTSLNFNNDGLPVNHFWDFGVGIDFSQSPKRKHDLSFDIGFRQTTHELPVAPLVSDCIDGSGNSVTTINENCRTTRTAPQVFFRVGITW
ncbi:MAG: hypothetical protein JW798_08890 [Prolixibacteraceae bacterium]|nr:hypothetical protein [Prolixibacteraceae bacterium]